MGSVVPQEGLWLDWCSYEAAKYAVEHWHYSGTMPAGKTAKIGVWEDGEFIGVVVFSRGGNRYLAHEWGLPQTQACELTRVALRAHTATVTRIVAVALRLLKSASPGLRLVVSYADPLQGHHGGIYAGGNWTYVGNAMRGPYVVTPNGYMHGRSATAKWGSIAGMKQVQLPKHKYLMPLDDAMRKQIEPLRQPYPKREDNERAPDRGA